MISLTDIPEQRESTRFNGVMILATAVSLEITKKIRSEQV